MTKELISIQELIKVKRFIVQGIEEEDFQQRAKQVQEAARAQGIDVGSVYHKPIKTGFIVVKGNA